MADTLLRLESFPFDSKQDGYDDDGYPIYDRAIGADVLRQTFAKFFSDGVFPNPADTLQVSKAASGIAVTVKPGLFIINGAMGVVKNQTMINLVDGTQVGNVIYSILLRYDENDDKRSCYIRVANGGAGGNAPEPEETASVKEYRLATVTVPNGATDMSGAIIKNEKGLAICPYAAPFEEIDISAVVQDAQNMADNALHVYLDYVDKYYELVESALDGTTADNLKKEIDDIRASAIGIESVDRSYLDMQDLDGDRIKRLGLVERSVGARELKGESVGTHNLINASVTPVKLSDEIKDLLGLLNTSSWDAARYLSYMSSLGTESQKETFIDNNVTPSVFGIWAASDQLAFINASPQTRKQALVDMFDFEKSSWNDVLTFAKGVQSGMLGKWIGKSKNVNCGTYGTAPFVIIGIDHDDKVSGGKAKLTIECKKLLWATNVLNHTTVSCTPYKETLLYSTCESFFNSQLSKDVKSLCSKVKKRCLNGTGDAMEEVQLNAFPVSYTEYTGVRPSFGGDYAPMMDGARYQYYAKNSKSGYDSVISPDAVAGKQGRLLYWTRSAEQRDGDEGNQIYYHTTHQSMTGGFDNTDPTYGTNSSDPLYHKYVRPAICLG